MDFKRASGGLTRPINNKNPALRLRRQPDGTPRLTPDGEKISSNWSGYIADGQRFTAASGRWRVPTVSYSSAGGGATQVSSAWVGIGGAEGDQTLIQLGTAQLVTSTGVTNYFAWYEMLDDPLIPIPASVFPVAPGDLIEGRLQCSNPAATPYTRENWKLFLRNLTQNREWESPIIPYTSSLATAEWIMEAVEVNEVISPMPRYNGIIFENMTANGAVPLLTLEKNAVAMADASGKRISSPSRYLPGTFAIASGPDMPASPGPFRFGILRPDLGGAQASVEGMNDFQTVIGIVGAHSFSYDIDLKTYPLKFSPSASNTQARGINNRGEIVGLAVDKDKVIPFLYDGKNFSALNIPPSAWPQAINDAGTVVGSFKQGEGDQGDQFGFINYRDGRFITSGYPKPNVFTVFAGINNHDQIAGFYHPKPLGSGPARGFLYFQGQYTDIAFPGAFATYPVGINDQGTVAGVYVDGGNASRGFILSGQTYTGFDLPNGKDVSVGDINNHGQVAGTFTDKTVSRIYIAYRPGRDRTPKFDEPVPQ
jgi:hypothetical protein